MGRWVTSTLANQKVPAQASSQTGNPEHGILQRDLLGGPKHCRVGWGGVGWEWRADIGAPAAAKGRILALTPAKL